MTLYFNRRITLILNVGLQTHNRTAVIVYLMSSKKSRLPDSRKYCIHRRQTSTTPLLNRSLTPRRQRSEILEHSAVTRTSRFPAYLTTFFIGFGASTSPQRGHVCCWNASPSDSKCRTRQDRQTTPHRREAQHKVHLARALLFQSPPHSVRKAASESMTGKLHHTGEQHSPRHICRVL